ncbi:UNVERIFIED_CONTAM: Loganic acid O-methyltransferase [Sesamum angustifolium]|uniref:Loganic acid O-methyltransferase n=1 Tax=Sesamum angustifolium TaxID=2727405 RepID=A0AAW2M926_9LAMI
MEGESVMNGGEGANSYAQNSSLQGGIVEAARPVIEEEISTKIDVKQVSSTFKIADFGCSTGHNSFAAMHVITQAISRKFDTEELSPLTPDFHVYFNDQVFNDFNTLFKALPPKRLYYAAGVPGSFRVRLLPKRSIDFAYTSFSLNWLSGAPKAVAEKTSPAWNNGKIHHYGARKEVVEAYTNQFAEETKAFLDCRAEELMPGGLLTILLPVVPASWNPDTFYTVNTELGVFGSCLVDLAKQGRFSEDKVDSFNLPLYFTNPEEFKGIIESSNNYTVERMETLYNPGKRVLSSGPKVRATIFRAAFEFMLINHFGGEIIDELFDLYANKLAASPVLSDAANDKTFEIIVVLKRKPS